MHPLALFSCSYSCIFILLPSRANLHIASMSLTLIWIPRHKGMPFERERKINECKTRGFRILERSKLKHIIPEIIRYYKAKLKLCLGWSSHLRAGSLLNGIINPFLKTEQKEGASLIPLWTNCDVLTFFPLTSEVERLLSS